MLMVLATDGSELAIAAGRRALELVRPDTEMVLVAATGVDPSDDTGAGGIEGPDVSVAELERMRSEAHVAADGILTKTAADVGLVGVHAAVVDGAPVPAICAFAGERGADLIVVGSHGRGPVRRTLLGSVSDGLVRHAPCPVLVVRSGTS